MIDNHVSESPKGELVGLYRDIGRIIVDRQSGETWGKAVVEQLSMDLHFEFSGMEE